MPRWIRTAALGSAVGPLSFVAAWAIGDVTTDRPYSPTRDTISRLAAVGADTRSLMTGGMVVFGVAVTASAAAWRKVAGGRTWMWVAAAGVSTLAVAATPLEQSALVDRLHHVAAGVGYATLAAIPVAARSALTLAGFRRCAVAGTAVTAVSASSLAVSLVVERAGLFQRIGLTVVDLWLIAASAALLSSSSRWHGS